MRITAKVDYGIRAMAELAAAPPDTWVKADAIAVAQGIPVRFLLNILRELRGRGLVRTFRGPEGGYRLALPPDDTSIGEIIRALEGPLAAVQGVRPDELRYAGPARRLPSVWLAVRSGLRAVLDRVTLADLLAERLPPDIEALARDSPADPRAARAAAREAKAAAQSNRGPSRSTPRPEKKAREGSSGGGA
jgi:Rrf2 family protein